MEKTYKNVYYLFIALFVTTFIGFYKTYFGLIPHFEGLKNVYHIHATALLLWIGLLISQPLLIKYKKIEIHRLLGKVSYFLVPFVVYSIILVSKQQYERGVSQNLSAFELNFGIYMSFADIVPFVILYGLAMWYRRTPSVHMRYIIACSVIFFNPALGRVFIFYWGIDMFLGILLAYLVCDLILFGFLVLDYKQSKGIKIYLYSLLFLLFWHTSFLYIPKTELWQSIAQSIVKVFY